MGVTRGKERKVTVRGRSTASPSCSVQTPDPSPARSLFLTGSGPAWGMTLRRWQAPSERQGRRVGLLHPTDECLGVVVERLGDESPLAHHHVAQPPGGRSGKSSHRIGLGVGQLEADAALSRHHREDLSAGEEGVAAEHLSDRDVGQTCRGLFQPRPQLDQQGAHPASRPRVGCGEPTLSARTERHPTTTLGRHCERGLRARCTETTVRAEVTACPSDS
jgi:hypothetical protein